MNIVIGSLVPLSIMLIIDTICSPTYWSVLAHEVIHYQARRGFGCVDNIGRCATLITIIGNCGWDHGLVQGGENIYIFFI